MGVVLLCWEVKISETEINYFYSFCLWVDQNVKWFDVTMHDTL